MQALARSYSFGKAAENLFLKLPTKVKPEAATAVIELLMMGGKTPETC
jgi:hypothetical protein